MMKMKKIVFLTLSLTRGGAERVIANLCNDAFSSEYDVTVIMCMKAPMEYSLAESVKTVTLDQSEEEWHQGMTKRFPRRRRALGRILQDIRPDLIISFLPEPNFLALSLRRKLGIPTIISVRNDPVREYAGMVRTLLMKHLYPNADGYVFQTNQAKEYFAFDKHIMENCRVIMNPLNPIFLEEVPCNRDTKRIVTVGRLEKQKNQAILINAFIGLSERFPGWTLDLYGEGSLRPELETLIGDHADVVRLMGETSDMRGVFSQTALFVLPSLYEGMPNALMEAMAMGIPCIATDCPCGGPAMLIQNGENGLLVPVDDERALADAMEAVMTDGKLGQKLGANAKRIRESGDPKRVLGEWMEYARAIMNRV